MDSITAAEPSLILLDAQKTTIIRSNRFRCDHGGLKLREGFHHTVENSIMVNNSFHPHVWFRESHDIFRRNIVMTWYKPIRVDTWGDEADYNFLPDSAALPGHDPWAWTSMAISEIPGLSMPWLAISG